MDMYLWLCEKQGLYMTGQTAPGDDFPASWPNLGASGRPLADPLWPTPEMRCFLHSIGREGRGAQEVPSSGARHVGRARWGRGLLLLL